MAANQILVKMLDRLYAAMASGPNLNARPHNSRQRIDLTQAAKLAAVPPQQIITALLGDKAAVKLVPKVARPRGYDAEDRSLLSEEEKALIKAFDEQQAIVKKLHNIAEDARTFEQDTGAHALHLGFPILQLPPGKAGRGNSRRVLAPIAFIPVQITVKHGRVSSVELEGVGEGVDRVTPNAALLAFLEQQTGAKLKDLFADEEGKDPWRELNELCAAVAKAVELPSPPPLSAETAVVTTPKADDEERAGAAILPSAVIGLYPLSNQSLVQDMEALVEGERHDGPIESFLQANVALGQHHHEEARKISEERLVTHCDPCQARAVRLARSARGLVVHGPPGSGKSQTIANMVGDHLARGERVLVVCEKRTALDVVKHRLDALGLGHLVAVVHDAQRDQKELYLGIREQLDGLVEAKAEPFTEAEVARLDGELEGLYRELRKADALVTARPSPGEASFHELVGRWLAIDVPEEPKLPAFDGLRLGEVEQTERGAVEALQRAADSGYPDNPWRSALGTTFEAFQRTAMADHRARLQEVEQRAKEVDRTAVAELPAFDPVVDLAEQGMARASLADALEAAIADGAGDTLARWAAARPDQRAAARAELIPLAPQLQLVAQGPLDPELALTHRTQPLALPAVGQGLLRLGRYLRVARKWYAFFFILRRLAAAAIVDVFGLAIEAGSAERVHRFLLGLRARLLLRDVNQRLLSPGAPAEVPDEQLTKGVGANLTALTLLQRLERERAFASSRAAWLSLLAEPSRQTDAVRLLRQSKVRSDAIAALEAGVEGTGLFSSEWRSQTGRDLRAGVLVEPLFTRLLQRSHTLESLLRIDRLRAGLPKPVGDAVRLLAIEGQGPKDGWAAVIRAALAAELRYRLRTTPELGQLDAEHLSATQARVRALDAQKKERVRALVAGRWLARQKERLVATTGSRLGAGATELRRRLMVRGQRVMRVRQMIAAGSELPDGDPLFELRPVWMASPETVAQVFQRAPLFDVVIFDESSQCRLEEALPVLTRAKRVVIAGDPKQLPPTRFFESAFAQSSEEEPETDQGLFEAQQAESEDLLTAALNLDVEQCYLDVHYRSVNADLIEFSNQHFYGSRLQAIPGHPSRRAIVPPLRLVQVGGTYEKRVNLAEARAVVELVKELLGREKPPSIGIACFNLSQREAILEALDEAADADATFGKRLEEARNRRGAGSFEGLFVKNLENVQGDERDHLIISTTYGPDAKGRFYRRFGPLGQAGGGRRLNVLVTRAREEVHLLTSIPRDQYRSLPAVESGQAPNGGWLLFSYLQFAEKLREQYGSAAVEEAPSLDPEVIVRRSDTRSPVAEALGARLAKENGVSTEVHWGNEGFCVDVAVKHPRRPDEVPLGLLIDGSRFDKSLDRVEWDLFRTAVLEGLGWKLQRVLTPQFFRDPTAVFEKVAEVLPRKSRHAAPAAVTQGKATA